MHLYTSLMSLSRPAGGTAAPADATACMCRYTKPEPMIRMMSAIKQVFDPNLIMNPYKLLPNNPTPVSA